MQNIIKSIKGSDGKDILIDVTFQREVANKKIVIFSHGFKGFKDWGCFDLISNIFAENQFVFIKFNFSHNGTTISDPLNFVDLESFGNNNFSKELNDLGFVLDWIENEEIFQSADISLIGHSRGGGISILKSSEDKRVKRVISWSSPSNFLNKMSDARVKLWRRNKVIFVYNGRTKQNMPMYIQFYNDCLENESRLDIQKSVRLLTIPQLIIHGSADPTVNILEAKKINKWNKNSKLIIIQKADHVFGASHPYISNQLPRQLQQVVEDTIDFINL